MDDLEKRHVCFHEVGHMAMVFWNRENLDGYRIVIHQDRFGGSMGARSGGDWTDEDLMKLLGGPMAEYLAQGIVPQGVLRFSNEYRDPNSDSTRIRNLLRRLRGKDDRRYQFEVQERVREWMQRPATWQAITEAAERVFSAGEVDGLEFQRIFEQLGVEDRFGVPAKDA
jgi:hypothetical protein